MTSPAWLSHYRRQSGRDLLKAALGGLLLAVVVVVLLILPGIVEM